MDYIKSYSTMQRLPKTCAIVVVMSKKQQKIVPAFVYMEMSYIVIEDNSSDIVPAMRRCGILNDGRVIVREHERGTGRITHEEIYQADVYEIATLYDNFKRILSCDNCEKKTASIDTKTVQILFQIVYSKHHEETCSPFLTDENGISIMSVFDGFLAFVKQEHTYYNWCEVIFDEYGTKRYSYFYKDDSIKIGDKVIVPVGKDNKEQKATVVNFWRLAEENLPFPAEKTKWIIRRLKPYSINAFLKKTSFTEETTFLITDRDGHKNKCHIIGDHRSDKNAKEPYIKCWLFVGIYRDYKENEIASIRKLKDTPEQWNDL